MGENCKYNGGNNYSEKLHEFIKGHEVIMVCPEVMGGLPTPRLPSEIVGDRVVNSGGADVTNESEIRVFFASYDFSKIINDENVLNDSINCINKLIDSKMFEISFLTHVNSLTEGCVKVDYLRKHFKDITIIMVPKEISKTKVVHSEGAILVDDYSGNLKEWEENGGIAVRFSKELESHGYKVLNHLDELIDMFKKEEEETC